MYRIDPSLWHVSCSQRSPDLRSDAYCCLSTMMLDVERCVKSSLVTCCCLPFAKRRIFLSAVVVLLLLALLSTVPLSSWDACMADGDNEFDVADSSDADAMKTRFTKTCLSPRNNAGLRFNISLESPHLRRLVAVKKLPVLSKKIGAYRPYCSDYLRI